MNLVVCRLDITQIMRAILGTEGSGPNARLAGAVNPETARCRA